MSMIYRVSLAIGLLAVAAMAAAQAPGVLYEKQSQYNTILVTEDAPGLRTLLFEKHGARQSVVKLGDPDHLELPYTRVMAVGLAVVQQPQRVLIVGLGGGTIPTFLRKHYAQTAIDVVDIDPEVAEVAKTYFGFREDGSLRVHVADGRKFIETCGEPYDIIFLDAFGSDNIPRHLATREFLQATARGLKPGGVVVSNVWGPGSNPLYESMVCTYRDVFAELCIVDVPGGGNKILVALPRRVKLNPEELAQRATEISRQKQWRFDLGDLLRQGLQKSVPPDSHGRVLRDDDPQEDR